MADWRMQAACRGLDTSLFFPERGDYAAVEAAKAVCSSCPVRVQCLVEALELPREMAEIGIWGGTSARQRRIMMKGVKRPVAKPARCGTDAGYNRHRRASEDACSACREAHARAIAGRKASAA